MKTIYWKDANYPGEYYWVSKKDYEDLIKKEIEFLKLLSYNYGHPRIDNEKIIDRIKELEVVD